MKRWTGCLLLCVALSVGRAGAIAAQTAADVDFDNSGKVDFPDFLRFAGAYHTTNAQYDLDHSGAVDFQDFLIFAGLFGRDVYADAYDILTVKLSDGVSMDFVRIDPGTFTMGSPIGELGRNNENEGPQHQVTLSAFYLGRYEVTQGQWEAIMGTTPWRDQFAVQENANHPAVYVSWNDAQAFVHRLNVAAGDSLYRLPTEAEWEYACRAGTTTRWSFGDDEFLLPKYAWYVDNAWNVSEEYAHTVGTKLPNPWGLHDMHGNVWEWCQDWYDRYSSESQTNPTGPSSPGPHTGELRVIRGGNFQDAAQNVRSAVRDGFAIRTEYVGFRLFRRAY